MRSISIIGQGIAGLAAGFRLLQKGVEVEFFGPDHTEKSASKAAVGVSAQKGVLIPRDPLFQLKALGHSHLPNWFKEIEKVSGVEIKISPFGEVIERSATHEEFQKTAERIYKRDFLGCYRVEVLSQKDSKVSLLKFQEDYFFDVSSLFKSLRIAVQKLGSTAISLPVDKISISNENYILQLGSQSINRSNILIAAGFESQIFLDQLGVKKHSLTGVGGRSFESKSDSNDFCEVNGQYALVQINNMQRLGSSTHQNQDFSPSAEEDFLKLKRSFPISNTHSPKPIWGVRARFPDRLPRFGVVHELSPDAKAWISCGFYKSGLQLSDLISRTLVQKMVGNFSESDPNFKLMKNFIW